MGSAFRLHVVTGVDLPEALEWAEVNGYISTAADISATASHTHTDWTLPRLLVFGSEAHGLNENILARMSELTVIDLANGVESLNLAVASGIILFEAKRQNVGVE
jgi:TrmH family RNA methyltransferase